MWIKVLVVCLSEMKEILLSELTMLEELGTGKFGVSCQRNLYPSSIIGSHCGCCGHTSGYSGTVHCGICCHSVIPGVDTVASWEKSQLSCLATDVSQLYLRLCYWIFISWQLCQCLFPKLYLWPFTEYSWVSMCVCGCAFVYSYDSRLHFLYEELPLNIYTSSQLRLRVQFIAEKFLHVCCNEY